MQCRTAGAFARLMFPLAAASILGVRSPGRRMEEVRMKSWVHSMRSALRGPDFDVVLAFVRGIPAGLGRRAAA